MLKRIGAEESGEFKAVASGTLSSGKPVVINSDGTVSVVTPVASQLGTPVEFEGGSTQFVAAAYDTSTDRVVIAYTDSGNGGFGTAVVGTISGTSISFGTPVVFESANADMITATYDASNEKIVIAYRDVGNSQHGTAIVGTVSGTTISFGTAVVFESAQTDRIASVYDSTSEQVVIAYRDDDNNDYGTAIVGKVSGSSISFGSPTVFEEANVRYLSIVYDSSNEKIVIAYEDIGNSDKGTAIVGTVSGTSISFGTAVKFKDDAVSHVAAAYDEKNQKVVVIWMDQDNNDHGTAVVGTVSGTSISFGGETVYEAATSRENKIIYDPASEKIFIAFRDGGNSNKGTGIVGTVSDASISFDTAFVFEAGAVEYLAVANDPSTGKVIIGYEDEGNSDKGTAVVYSVLAANVTSKNYIGMSRGGVSESALSIGATSVVNTGTNGGQAIAYDTNSDRVVIAYKDTSNGHGKAVVGTVSGSGISFGTPVTFNAANTTGLQPSHGIAFDSSNNKVVIVYKDNGNSNYGTAIVGTVDPSDNSISFGSEAVFESAHATFPTVVFDSSNNKFLISYSDVGDSSKGKAIVGTVSGTSISFGSAAEFEAGDVNHETLMSTFDSANNKAVIAYRDGGDSNKGKAVVATISGTSVSFGTPVEFTENDFFQSSITFDSTSNKVIIIFPDQGNSQFGTARTGTVSGTSISFGTAVVWHSGSAQRNSVSYSSTADKSIVFFRDGAASDIGKLVELTVSGTSITASSAQQFSATTTSASSSVFDPDNNVIVNAYIDEGNTTDLETVQVTGTTINRGQVADGGNASIDIIGSVSDNQLNLTAGQQYFVQSDGTIGETADSPSVLAGTAISATELLVKT